MLIVLFSFLDSQSDKVQSVDDTVASWYRPTGHYQITTTCCCLSTRMLGSKKVLVLIVLFSFLDSQSDKVQSVDDTVASWYRPTGHYQITTTCCCLSTRMLGSKKVLVLIILCSFLDSQSHKVQSVDDTVASSYRYTGHHQITTTCCCLGPGMLGSKKVLVFIILFSFLDSQSDQVQSFDDTVASWYRSPGHDQITTTCCCLGIGMLGSKKVLVLIILFLDSQSDQVQAVDDTVASWYRYTGHHQITTKCYCLGRGMLGSKKVLVLIILFLDSQSDQVQAVDDTVASWYRYTGHHQITTTCYCLGRGMLGSKKVLVLIILFLDSQSDQVQAVDDTVASWYRYTGHHQITTTCYCLGRGMLGSKKVLVLIILFLDSQSDKVQSVDDTVASWYRSTGHYQITTTCCCLSTRMLGSKKVLVLIVLFSFLDSQSDKVQSVDDTVASWYYQNRLVFFS